MTIDPGRQALTILITNAICHVRREIPSAQAAVALLEKPARDSLIAIYGAERAWRGLACDHTIAIHDALTILLGHDPLADHTMGPPLTGTTPPGTQIDTPIGTS